MAALTFFHSRRSKGAALAIGLIIAALSAQSGPAHAGCDHRGMAPTDQRVTDGPEVFLLQRSLVALGYLDASEVDGDIGPITQGALRRFQAEAGLQATGEADPLTLEAIHETGAKQGIGVFFAPSQSGAHERPGIAASLRIEGAGACFLTLTGEGCPSQEFKIAFPTWYHPPGYKNTSRRLAVDADGAPVYQHIGNAFLFVWVQSSGAGFPANTSLIGITQSCDAVFRPSEAALRATVEGRMILDDSWDYADPSISGTKELSAQYQDILTQAGREDLRGGHPRSSYSQTRFHRWDHSSECD